MVLKVPPGTVRQDLEVKVEMRYLKVANRLTGEVYMEGRLWREIIPEVGGWPEALGSELRIHHPRKSLRLLRYALALPLSPQGAVSRARSESAKAAPGEHFCRSRCGQLGTERVTRAS